MYKGVLIYMGVGSLYVQGGPHLHGGRVPIYEYRDGGPQYYIIMGTGSPKVRGPQYYMTPEILHHYIINFAE